MSCRLAPRLEKEGSEILPSPKAYIEGRIFVVPGPLYRRKTIYENSHLASLGPSIFCVPESI